MQTKPPLPLSSDSAAVTDGGDLQILLIRLGARSFGVPLADVRYVATMPSDFASSGAEAEDHFVFEGSPLSYVSLWDTLGLKSEYAEYGDMQAMLPLRRQDHLDWMNALENSIRTGTPFTKARSPHECAFGKWFYGYHSKDRRLSLLLGQFETPHATIHSLADKLMGLTETGQSSDALRAFDDAKHGTLATLMKLFDSAEELVVELQRRIAVIVAAGDNTCALGADGIRDIVSVPAAQVKHHSGTAGGATSALLILDERTVVPLLNWRGFSTDAPPTEG